MNEWNVHGNPSERFPGYLMSKSLQEQIDVEVATERLREYLPDNCRTCLQALYYKVKDVAHRVVKDEMSKGTAIDAIECYSGGCEGGIKDEFGNKVGCPSQQRAEEGGNV